MLPEQGRSPKQNLKLGNRKYNKALKLCKPLAFRSIAIKVQKELSWHGRPLPTTVIFLGCMMCPLDSAWSREDRRISRNQGHFVGRSEWTDAGRFTTQTVTDLQSTFRAR